MDRGVQQAESAEPEAHRTGKLLGGQRRHAEGRAVAWEDGVHRRLQGPRHRASPRAQAERRRRRAGRSCRPRRRAARGRSSTRRLLPLLGTRARPRRLRRRTVRRELHGRGTQRRRGLHRRPLPDRHRRLRGHATPRHLLPRRHPAERPAHPGPARVTPPPRVLLPRARGGRGRGGRRDHQARLRPRADDRSPRSTRSSISRGTRASTCFARCGSPPSAPAGRRRSRPCSRESPAAGTRPGRDEPAPGLAGFRRLAGSPARAGIRLRRSRSASRIPVASRFLPRAPASTSRSGSSRRNGQRSVLRNYSLSGPPDAGYLPDHRQTRTRWRRQRLSAYPASRRRPARHRSTARHLHPRPHERARAADQRRASARHRSSRCCRRRESIPIGRSGGSTAHAAAAITRSPAETRDTPRVAPGRARPRVLQPSRPGRPQRPRVRQRRPAHGLVARRPQPPRDAEAYLCGPTPFMERSAPVWQRSDSTPRTSTPSRSGRRPV